MLIIELLIARSIFSIILVMMLREIYRRLKQSVSTFAGLCLVSYCLYHTLEGNHGLLSWVHLRHDLEQTQSQLLELRNKRETLEKRVQLLRSSSLDPDLLEERAKALLGYAHPSEFILIHSNR